MVITKGTGMRSLTIFSSILIILVAGIGSAFAQDTGLLVPGRKVRIDTGARVYTGTMSSIDSDGITIRSLDLMETKTISKNDISLLEAYMGKRSSWHWGVLIGAPSAVLLAYISSVGTIVTMTNEDVAIFGAIGAVGGGLIGHFIKREVWKEIPLDRNLNIGFLPAAGGGYLTLSYSF